MGYPTLEAALPFTDNLTPQKTHITITDTIKSDANFLIHHFVGNQLKGRGHVVLVGLAHILHHYLLISRKLGIDLKTYKEKGQFDYLDGVTHLNAYTHNTPYPPQHVPSTPSGTLDGSKAASGGSHVLQTFYDTIQSHVKGKHRPLLVLDDASALLMSGFGLQASCTLIRKLKTLMEQVDGTLLTIVHADEDGADDPEQDTFVKSMINDSELVLQLLALGSGLARDVHGQLSIIYGPRYIPGSMSVQPQSLHYKILDTGAHFFAKGISQGVL